MTMVQFMQAVADTTDRADLRAYALDAIAKVDAKNKARRAKPTKAQADADALLDYVVGGMSATDVLTASDVAVMIGETTQKASAILQNGVKQGVLTASDVKGKSGKVKGYKLCASVKDTSAEDSAEG